MEEYKTKLDQAKRVVEAMEKLDVEQVKAFTDMIVGAAALNQLVKLNRDSGKPA